MILRKPYAFLIKHFRLIHLIMFGLLLYVILEARDIFNFFKDYIAHNSTIEVVSSNYISYFIFVSIFLVVGLSAVIFYLMKYKNKPRLFYIITIIFSLVSCVLFVYLYTCIKGLETTYVSGRAIRFFRDLARINFWLLSVSSVPMFFRGLGFDIKKFNFSKDAKELNLRAEDNDEVEVSSNFNADTVKRYFRKLARELKYYYKENKMIINIVLAVAIVILVGIPIFNKEVVNRSLNEGELLGTKDFNLRINSSYITERKRISKDNSYIILKISTIGKVEKYNFDLKNFILIGDNNQYIPSQKYYNYFRDVGIGYRNDYLSTTEYEDYILIYNIDNIDKDSNFEFKYFENGQKVKLNLKTLD